MFCPNCGKPIEKENAKYCSHCGATLPTFPSSSIEKKNNPNIEIHLEELKPILYVLLQPMKEFEFTTFASVVVMIISTLVTYWSFQYLDINNHPLILLLTGFLSVLASYAINAFFLQFFGKKKYELNHLFSTLTYLHIVGCFVLLLVCLCGLVHLKLMMLILGLVGYFIYIFQLLPLLNASFHGYLGAILLVLGFFIVWMVIFTGDPSSIPTF
ncbi:MULTISPECIES: zinc ribbon domain-containing protein [Terrabacteria group]|uniref:zinc ribbon domain-containing protein n=1 Tax=Bacillati TaxID=1783272 RepID=UPI001C6EAD25|nr:MULTISPECIES: zinc ribbon domain-containing protein [Terrabacteria group]MBW9212556.1 zinc ribbon domain-containing protein [Trueperella sp. zg.1013]